MKGILNTPFIDSQYLANAYSRDESAQQQPIDTVNGKNDLFFNEGTFDHVITQPAGMMIADLETACIEHG